MKTTIWTAVIVMFSGLVVAAFIAPLVYVWAVGLLACFAIGFGSTLLAGGMASNGNPVSFYFAAEIAMAGLRIVGVILMALCGVSSND
jgi:hypothetical protein